MAGMKTDASQPTIDQLLIESITLQINLGWTLLSTANVERGLDPHGVAMALQKSRDALAGARALQEHLMDATAATLAELNEKSDALSAAIEKFISN
jgi:ABC-type transporter Mla subunit MlaD